MGARLYGKTYRADRHLVMKPKYRADLALIRKIGTKADPEVVALIERLKRNAGTKEGAVIRGQIVRVISAARKEIAGKARAMAKL